MDSRQTSNKNSLLKTHGFGDLIAYNSYVSKSILKRNKNPNGYEIMPPKVALLTDWVTIGTAGPTVDGRTITDQWLTEMAESYDPDVYTAVINSEHLLDFYGSFGHVRELRNGKSKDDKVTLEARLEPNMRMLDMNLRGQRLFTSMEVIEDFADTGKAYLAGLAITDLPASLGTTELRFTRAAKHGQYRAAPVEVDGAVFTPAAPATGEAEDDASLARKLFTAFLSLCGQANHNPAQHGTTDMTPDEIKALMGKELDTRFEALKKELAEQFAAGKPEGEKPEGEKPESEKPAAAAEGTPDPVAALTASIEKQFSAQGKAIESLTEKLTAALAANGDKAGGKQTGDASANADTVL